MINNFRLRLVNHNTRFNTPLDDVTFYYDFTFVLSGELVYIFDDVPYTISAGSAIFLPPGSRRIRNPIIKNVDTLDYFSINFFTDETFDLPKIMYECVTPLVRASLEVIDLIYNSYSADIEKRISIELRQLLYSLQELNKHTVLPNTTKYDNPKIQAITNYIDTHLTEKLTLDRIAKHVSLTTSYCSTLMKRETGLSIFDYIIKGRMDLAKKYILENEKSLKEIAKICGYNDYGYFSRHFKRFIGCSPTKIDKK
ncbi:MAG: AraC family transcriptional regulator [Clostridia bacterium]|nr:AraC family transcriptional regulator [Clostridia bacterium]